MEGNSNPISPVVHVLVSEPFFWDKVESTLTALGWAAFLPDWEGDVLAQLLARDSLAVVVDLENDQVNAIEVLRAYLGSGKLDGSAVLAFASHEKQDLLDKARELGALAIVRSTFAASLVKVLQELCDPDPGNGGQAEAS